MSIFEDTIFGRKRALAKRKGSMPWRLKRKRSSPSTFPMKHWRSRVQWATGPTLLLGFALLSSLGALLQLSPLRVWYAHATTCVRKLESLRAKKLSFFQFFILFALPG